ncbi:efflux RND transporter permease subunit [Algicella marina]|uniref:AcrB/AcrD/AcrF family protein n=1 Tax=Algicella marina TaxID=2683284 RepID=A0A6P1T373_9RHOB|nr:efflux RND transporter permease subunit [Algicella marina]QHQ37178.1 AcrB/AcrD/AcrF family protein [Algicella marina]
MALRGEGVGGILSYFTRHRTAANLLLVIMVTLGLVAATQIRSQFFPDVVLSSVDVDVRWDGAGPEDVDGAIIAVLEPALRGVEGVTGSTATAREGSARIDLEFEPGWDMSRAVDDVTSAVDGVNNLPEGAETPEVSRNAWRDRVTDVVIHGPVAREQLGRFADEFVSRLFQRGVTRTTIRGVTAPTIRVEAPEAELIRHDIALSDIANAIGQETEASPAGDVAGGSARVRTGIEKRTAEEVASIVVRSGTDGSKLLVSDLARISVDGAEQGRAYYKDDNPAVSIRVDRSDQGDAIEMQRLVTEVAAELESILPPGVKVELIRTRAEAITERLDILFDNGLLGLALVVLLLFLFLSARTALWVAAGIPVAMIATIALMFAFGLTINMISLFALIICLGIVVDDAIVVGEHADFRVRTLGETPLVAAENAARRMSLPVFSSTVTTVIAFVGLTAIGGRFGSLISDIPFTVVVVLLASLVECFLILPNHMAHALASGDRQHWYDWPSRTFNKGFGWFCRRIFRPAMRLVLALRYPVLGTAVLVLALTASLYLRGDVTWRFFNSPERASISGNIAMLPGAKRADTLEMVRELQRAVRDTAARYEAEHGANPVLFALAEVGGTTGRGLAGSDTKDEDQLGSIAIELIDPDLRPYSSFAFLGDLQEEVRRHPLLETLSFRGWRSGPGGDALDVKFYGADATTLKAAAEDLKAAVSEFPEVSAVEDTLAYDKTELVLELTPIGSTLGFTIDGIGRELRQRLAGIEAASFPVGVRQGTIEVSLAEEELTADFLSTTRLRSPTGEYVPLSEIVTVDTKLGFSSVRRENGYRVITVSGDISEDDPVRAQAVMTSLQNEILPRITEERGVNYVLGGLAEQEREFLSDAALGFSLCMLGIYLTLCWIFASWTRPFVVMAVIPFGLIGAVWGHYLWDVPLSIFTVVGLIGMSGIIINDSIVLITTIDEYAEKRGLVAAVVDATVDRLRPVLLTTLTTVLGLAPLLYESSQQAQFLKPTVITLAYGLGVGMVLVLLIVPSLVIMQADLARIRASTRRGLLRSDAGSRARIVLGLSALASLAVLAATVGVFMVTGEVWAPLASVTASVGLTGGVAALALLLAGLVVVFLIGWVLAAFSQPRRRQVLPAE